MANKETENVDEEDIVKPSKSNRKNSKKPKLKNETRLSVWGIGFIVLSLLLTLSFFKMAGPVGNFLNNVLSSFLGVGYYILPVLIFIAGLSFMNKGKIDVARIHVIFGLVAFLSALSIMDIASNGKGESLNVIWGGVLGSIVSWPFIKLFGMYASILILGAILISSLIIIFDEKPNLMGLTKRIWNFFKYDLRMPKLSKNIITQKEEIIPETVLDNKDDKEENETKKE